MKYLKQLNESYLAVDEKTEFYTLLNTLPKERRPVFLPGTDAGVKSFLADQAEAAKPKEVTMRQARLALLQAGLLDKVTAAISSMPSPQKQAAEIEWEYSNSLKRSQPLVTQLGAALGLDSADLDALFLAASKI